MSVASVLVKSGFKKIQYHPLPKEVEGVSESDSAVSPATTPNNEQQRLLTDEGLANMPMQTDDPEFNDLIQEVGVR